CATADVANRSDGYARHREIDDELRQSCVALCSCFAGTDKGDHVMTSMAIGCPHLVAVQAPSACDSMRRRSHACQTRADVRLAHADAEDRLRSAYAWQVTEPWLLAPTLQDQRSRLTLRDPVRSDR